MSNSPYEKRKDEWIREHEHDEDQLIEFTSLDSPYFLEWVHDYAEMGSMGDIISAGQLYRAYIESSQSKYQDYMEFLAYTYETKQHARKGAYLDAEDIVRDR